MADDSVTIYTNLDESGVTSGVSKVKSSLGSIGSDASGPLSSLKSKFSEVGPSLADSVSTASIAAGNMIASFASSAVTSLGSIASDGVSASDSLKKFESTMSFAGYDDSAIQQAKTDMKAYADDTVYSLSTVTNTTAQLAANGVPNYEALVEAAGNLNAVAGGTDDTFSSVSMVLTQTAGAGKLTTENWNQLANAIPGASGQLQQALLDAGAYTGNFRDAMENGEITAGEFNDAIMTLGFSDAAQEAATSTDTFEGATGQLQAAFEGTFMQIWDAVNQNGGVTSAITAISDAVSENAPAIAGFVSQFASAFAENLPMIMAVMGQIGDVLMQILPVIGQVLLAVAPYIPTIIGIIAAVVPLISIISMVANAINAVMLVVSVLGGPITAIIAIIAVVVGVLVYLWNTNEGFRNAVIAAWDAVCTAAQTIWDAIVGFFTTAGTNIQTAWQAVCDFFAGIPGAIEGFFSGIGDGISSFFQTAGDTVQNIWNGVVSFFTGLPDQVIGFFSGIPSIGDIFSGAADVVNNAGQGIIDFFGGIPDQIMGFFSGLHIEFPHINLPHFSISGEFNLDPANFSVPTLGIDWYATGGIFDSASVIGVGEAGREAALPLNSRSYGEIASGISDAGGSSGGMTVDEMRQAIESAIAEAVPKVVVYLDKRAVIGQLSYGIDRSIGTSQMLAGRGAVR